MKRFGLSVAALAIVSACGSDPVFNTDDGDNGGTPTPEPTIPEEVAGNITGVTYDAANQTLTVTGTGLDDVAFEDVYTRKPALDIPGYEAYTAQDGSLNRHFTAFVREIDGTYGAVVGSGGQFATVIQGVDYGRNGTYTAPATTPNGGVVTYAGNYAGVINGNGTSEDLLPVAPGTDPVLLPGQVAEVVGSVLINAGFGDTQNQVDGVIYNRRIRDSGVETQDLFLTPTAIEEDGSFTNTVILTDLTSVGTYGGLFGGTEASAVVGGINVSDHIETLDGETEYGVFVLGKCGGANADPICDQPHP